MCTYCGIWAKITVGMTYAPAIGYCTATVGVPAAPDPGVTQSAIILLFWPKSPARIFGVQGSEFMVHDSIIRRLSLDRVAFENLND